MLESLDTLIGFSVVMLIFSLAATAILQSILSLLQLRGWHLLGGIASLLRQIDPTLDKKIAKQIAAGVVKHPMISRGPGQLGSVVEREELIQLLLGLAASKEPRKLESEAQAALSKLLANTGIPNPDQTAKDIRANALQLELTQPELAVHVRKTAAIIREASSEFVAGINNWFDATMERVSQEFTSHVRIATGIVALALALAVQLDAVNVLNQLAIDKDLRAELVRTAEAMAERGEATPTVDSSVAELRKLATSRLITLPGMKSKSATADTGSPYPGILLSAVLIGLGAPFWFRILKNLLNLRSTLAAKEDAQRADRREQPAASASKPSPGSGNADSGEQGDLAAVG